MTILLVGIGALGLVLGLFYLKDHLRRPTLARIAHSEPIMRVAVVAAALIVIGLLLVVNQLLGA